MSEDAETLARVMLEIERIIGDYIEPTNKARDGNLTIEEILLEMDTSNAIGAAHNILKLPIQPPNEKAPRST